MLFIKAKTQKIYSESSTQQSQKRKKNPWNSLIKKYNIVSLEKKFTSTSILKKKKMIENIAYFNLEIFEKK